MLRITMSDSSEQSVTLLLEGGIINGWVSVLHDSCQQALIDRRELTLNLRGVTFADNAGIALLRDLQQRRVNIVGSSGFIRRLLNPEVSNS
jgi:ABC-type transporter Mla MlaB component